MVKISYKRHLQNVFLGEVFKVKFIKVNQGFLLSFHIKYHPQTWWYFQNLVHSLNYEKIMKKTQTLLYMSSLQVYFHQHIAVATQVFSVV